ncbi:MAG: hypothetical protein Q8L01_00605, partial [Candidatus Woesebacteria bacterium]|nr:hypothetical protein [Candidatus Woesebacteria bacterium]
MADYGLELLALQTFLGHQRGRDLVQGGAVAAQHLFVDFETSRYDSRYLLVDRLGHSLRLVAMFCGFPTD